MCYKNEKKMGNSTAIKMARAFVNGQRLKLGNYESTGSEFILFGNTIAELCAGGFLIYDCGWCTATTAQALNTLPGVRLRRLKGEWIWNEKSKWNGKELFVEYKN
jgi:hypothetical protein